MNCENCGAYGLEPGEACDCQEQALADMDFMSEGVLLGEIAPLSREEFFDMLVEDDQYTGLLDPDDFENILIATVINLDKKIQVLLKENQQLKGIKS
jgi:hypothetical protein